MTSTFSSSKICSRSSKFSAMLPVHPKQRKPEIQFDDYTQTNMSRTQKWTWFLSSARTDFDDPEEHLEMDYLELCHQKEGPGAETVGKGRVVWIVFVDEKGFWVEIPSECGYVEVVVEDINAGKSFIWDM